MMIRSKFGRRLLLAPPPPPSGLRGLSGGSALRALAAPLLLQGLRRVERCEEARRPIRPVPADVAEATGDVGFLAEIAAQEHGAAVRRLGVLREGVEAPAVCPACAHPQARFELEATNY